MNVGKSSTTHGAESADRKVLGECPPGWVPTPHGAAIDARVTEMRTLLARMRPVSDSEALQCLRRAFPESSLAARVAAMATPRG